MNEIKCRKRIVNLKRCIAKCLTFVLILQMFGFAMNEPFAAEIDLEQGGRERVAELNVLGDKANESKEFPLSEAEEEQARAYARSNASRHIATFLGMSTVYEVACREDSPFYLGDGYYTYQIIENELICNKNINYPILQNGKVVLILTVTNSDGKWTCGASYDYSDELNRMNDMLALDEKPIVVYKDGAGYIYSSNAALEIKGNRDGITKAEMPLYDELKAKMSSIEKNMLLNKRQRQTDYIGYVTSPLNNSERIAAKAVTPGFNINEPTYKILEMANCFVTQRDASGKNRNVCWAASAAVIIRYRSGAYRNLSAFNVADWAYVGYNTGALLSTTNRALHHYSSACREYQFKERQPVNITEVYHNINNCFPISMGGPALEIPINAHAVTIIGYNGNNLIYWDSNDATMRTCDFHNNTHTPYFSGGSTYYWIHSCMVPLYFWI